MGNTEQKLAQVNLTAKVGWLSGLSVIVLALGLLWSSIGHTTAIFTANSTEEYQRKAEFVLNFCRLSESPSKPFSSPIPSFILGILGEVPLDPFIEELAGKKCVGSEINVVHYSIEDDYTKSSLLFIGSSEQHNLDTILSRLEGKTILTIGDFEGFAERGGMFEFSYDELPDSVIENARKVRFRVNPGAAEAANIGIGVTLTKLGEVVHTKSVASETEDDRISIAILPPWETAFPNVRGVGRGYYQSIEANQAFRITHAADPDLAHKLGAEQLTVSDSDRKRIWKQVGKTQHSEPVVEAVKELVKGTNVRAVFMYSSPVGGAPAGTTVSRRAYLVDLETDRVYRVDKLTYFASNSNYAPQTKELGDELLSNYLEDLAAQPAEDLAAQPTEDLAAQPIRVAILPPWEFNLPNIRGFGRGFYQSIEKNQAFRITHAADPDLAKKLSAEVLTVSDSDRKRIWKQVGKTQHSEPVVEAVKEIVKGTNVRAVFMYSSFGPPGETRRAFLVDLETDRVYRVDKKMYFMASGDYAYQTKELGNELLSNYLEDLATQPAEDLAAQPIRVAILPPWEFPQPNIRGIGPGYYQSLEANAAIRITHAADPGLANKLGAELLTVSDSDRKRIWKQVGKTQQSKPVVKAVKEIVKGTNVQVVFMYSSPSSHDLRRPAYLVDLETDRVYRVSKYLRSDAYHEYSDQTKEMGDELLENYLEDRGKIKIAILPPWEFHNPEGRGFGRGFYLSLEKNQAFRITHAVDPELANKLGAELLTVSDSDRKRIWKQVGKIQHSEPVVEAVREITKGTNVRAVFMYSSPGAWDLTRRAFLVDLETDRVYRADKSMVAEPSGNYSIQTKELGDELLSNYLEDRDKIRIAILPARNLNRVSPLKSEAVFQPLASNNKIQVTHVAEGNLARKLGAKELKTSRSQQNDIWKKAGFDQNTEPDIEAVIAMAKNLDVRLALMYSYPHSHTSPSDSLSDLQLFMVDVETGELFVSEITLVGMGSKSASVGDMANNLISNYLEDLAAQPSEDLAAQPTVDLAAQPAEVLAAQPTEDLAAQSTEDLAIQPIRVAILPPWDFNATLTLQGLGREIYLSLRSHEEVSIGYAAGKKIAKELGAQPIEADRQHVWNKSPKNHHSTPDSEAVKQLVNGLNLDAVFMYSIPNDLFPSVKAYMFDLKSGKVYQNTEITKGTPLGSTKSIAAPLVRELLSNYLEDRNKIRVAILPDRNLNHAVRLKSWSVFKSLASNNKIQVTHVAEGKLAGKLGAEELKTSRSQQKGIWIKARARPEY